MNLDSSCCVSWSESESAPAPKNPGGGFRAMGLREGGPGAGAPGFRDLFGTLRPKPTEAIAPRGSE
ncbi:hypothetical protein BDZ91DRAFT_746553 [Kalaharituber pfeilii]|nr:hypothetical protein BDZ91DRAFT_746553 [Kalaharituber pfeilii]